MKKTILKAVIIASLAAGFTACDDTKKRALIAEMENAIPGFYQLDSTLSSFRTHLAQRKDSLLGVAATDAIKKPTIDSLLLAEESSLLRLDSVAGAHSGISRGADSLKSRLADKRISFHEAKTEWEKIMAEHSKSKEFADGTNLALLVMALSERKDTAQVNLKEKE